MIALSAEVRIHLATGATDLRKGFDGLAALVQQVLHEDPFGGHLFVFRGKRADRVKIMFWDGTGLVRGRFVWPSVREGVARLSAAQLAMLLEGIDWRAPRRTDRTGAHDGGRPRLAC